MSHSRYALVLATSAAIGITSAPLLAQSPVALSENQQEVLFKKPGYSPYVGRNYPTQVFWSDQHVHSGWSMDAGTSGTG